MSKTLLTLSRLAAQTEPSEGTRIADARQSVDYWSRRADDLPWRQRTARREARMHAASARAQLIGAHIARWGLPALDQRLTPWLDTGSRSAGGHARSLAFGPLRRTAFGRRIMFAATGLAVASVAGCATVIALAVHFLSLGSEHAPLQAADDEEPRAA